MTYLKTLHRLFLLVDVGFILYWAITWLNLIPSEYLYNDYSNELLVHWNWSFFPLDMLVSTTGLRSIYLFKKANPKWRSLTLISLVLTSCSGLQAISFWVYHHDYNWGWWVPNLFLLCYPIYFIVQIVKEK
jgi:hypothetical protein